MPYKIEDLGDDRSLPLVVKNTVTGHPQKYFARAQRAVAEHYIAERDAIDAIPVDRRPTSQEVSEVAVQFGVGSEAYRRILSCQLGTCLLHEAHRRNLGRTRPTDRTGGAA